MNRDVFTNRLIIAIVVVIIAFIIIIGRSYKFQITQHQYYKQQSLGNSLTLATIVPMRGRIFDRNGVLLADNKLVYKLTIIPEKAKDVELALEYLKQNNFITDADIANFNKKRKQFRAFDNIPIKENFDETQAARFLVKNTMPGIEVLPYFNRVYPADNASSHVLGYIAKMNKEDKEEYSEENYEGTDFVGKTGIEKQYERALHGTRGLKQIERDARGRIINENIIKNATSGKDLYLSIDNNLQIAAKEALKNMRGSIVIISVKTGEVLAMYSAPSFDNNLFPKGISVSDYNKLNTNKNLPLFNRSIRGTYPPGSTIKQFVALSGLETGVIEKKHTVFCPGYYKLPNYSRKFNDWKRTGHGTVGVVDSIAESCDIFYYDLARKMGIDALHNNMSNFGFGAITGINLPGEEAGIMPSKDWKKVAKKEPWYEGETLITGIGQGFMTATPLQLAYATTIIANYGQKNTPTLIKDAPTQSSQTKIKDIENWNLAIQGMEQTIYGANGTARRINNKLNYTLAGKTGTAQVFGLDPEEKYIAERYAEHLRDHALFVGFAPIKNPEVAISVIAENAGSGSVVAAPIAKKILDVYFANKQK